MNKKIFANRIVELRKESKLTQKDLGLAIGLSRDVIHNIERGISTNLDYLIPLADYFKVSLDYLYGRTDNRKGKYFNSGGEEAVALEPAV